MISRPKQSAPDLVEQLIGRFMARRPLRTGSMIVTLFGDSIAPRGGEVWLGSLIEVLAGIGISERMVRTAVFRLARDGMLENERVGRRSYYRLSAGGRAQFEAATARIYFDRGSDRDGRWTLVVLGRLDSALRTRLRRELAWLGFGALATDLMAHPGAEVDGLRGRLLELGVADRVPVMSAVPDDVSTAGLERLVEGAWDLAALEAAYGEFIATFGPLDAATRASPAALGEAGSFYLRTLLVHDYRRILLRDPGLPDTLLPDHWRGDAAQRLAGRLYRRLAHAGERFVDRALVNRGGPLPAAGPEFERRFGGLGGPRAEL